MSPELVNTLGMILGALLGGGIVKAVVDYLRNRHVGELEERQFDFTTLKELNDLLRKDLNGMREELSEERRLRVTELAEERARRQRVEEELALAKQRIRVLESRMEAQERKE
jgi:hypothetical protein